MTTNATKIAEIEGIIDEIYQKQSEYNQAIAEFMNGIVILSQRITIIEDIVLKKKKKVKV